jgi:hypothetical protein
VEALKAYSRLLYDGGFHGGRDAKRPEALAAKIEVGRDLGIPATQAIAWIAIINGRPSIYGDLGLALIRQSGLLATGYPKEWYEGTEGEDDYTACFRVKRVDAEERTERFSVADARTAKLWGNPGPWTTYPKRQLMWRAKGFACRDEFQDVLCGLIFVEEAADIPTEPRVVVATGAEPPKDDPPAAAAVPPPTPGPPSLPAAKGVPAAAAGEDTFSLVDPRSPHSVAGRGQPLVADDQLEELARLRDLAWAAKGLTDEAEQDADWAAVLADFGVESARQLTTTQAAELIQAMGAKHDPFSYPPPGAKVPAAVAT